MVSGFLTSPLDQERMASGDATVMRDVVDLVDLVQAEQLAGAFFGADHTIIDCSGCRLFAVRPLPEAAGLTCSAG